MNVGRHRNHSGPFTERSRTGAEIPRFYLTNRPDKSTGDPSSPLSSRFGVHRKSKNLVHGMTRGMALIKTDPEFKTRAVNLSNLSKYFDTSMPGGTLGSSHLYFEEKEVVPDRFQRSKAVASFMEEPTNYGYTSQQPQLKERKQARASARTKRLNQLDPFHRAILADESAPACTLGRGKQERPLFDLKRASSRRHTPSYPQVFPKGQVSPKVQLGVNSLSGGNSYRTQNLVNHTTRGRNHNIISHSSSSKFLNPTRQETPPHELRISRGYGHVKGTDIVYGQLGDSFGAALHALPSAEFNNAIPYHRTMLRPPYLSARASSPSAQNSPSKKPQKMFFASS